LRYEDNRYRPTGVVLQVRVNGHVFLCSALFIVDNVRCACVSLTSAMLYDSLGRSQSFLIPGTWSSFRSSRMPRPMIANISLSLSHEYANNAKRRGEEDAHEKEITAQSSSRIPTAMQTILIFRATSKTHGKIRPDKVPWLANQIGKGRWRRSRKTPLRTVQVTIGFCGVPARIPHYVQPCNDSPEVRFGLGTPLKKAHCVMGQL
jgi:hypothetical protein